MNQQDIFNLITNHTREVVPLLVNHDFKQTDSLKELGANSIDRSEIIMMTLESLSLNMPLIYVARAENIGDLASIIHGKI